MRLNLTHAFAKRCPPSTPVTWARSNVSLPVTPGWFVTGSALPVPGCAKPSAPPSMGSSSSPTCFGSWPRTRCGTANCRGTSRRWLEPSSSWRSARKWRVCRSNSTTRCGWCAGPGSPGIAVSRSNSWMSSSMPGLRRTGARSIKAGSARTPTPRFTTATSRRPEHLLERGAPLTLTTALSLERWSDVERLAQTATLGEKQDAFVQAALNGKAEALRRMLALGMDPTTVSGQNQSHGTALHHAVWSGSLEAVRVLVEAGAILSGATRSTTGRPIGWAEYAEQQQKDESRARQYQAIAVYLRAKGYV